MGYEGLFFARMHYAELAERAKNRSLEMLWEGLDGTAGSNRSMFTSTFLRGTYGQPDGFCFDALCANFEPIVDDPDLDGYNVEEKVTRLVDVVAEQVSGECLINLIIF
jgi:hypothetical protein